MPPSSSLPMHPSPARDGTGKVDSLTQTQFEMKQKLEQMEQEQQKRTSTQRWTQIGMIAATVAALLGNLTLLILFAIGASHCTGTKRNGVLTSEPGGMANISEAICEMDVSTRYWLIATLAVNTIIFVAMLPSIAQECCQLRICVRGWKGPVICFAAMGHLFSTCLLVGFMYTQGMDPNHLATLHAASVIILFATLVLATAVAATVFIHHEAFAAINASLGGKVSRSRRNSLDLEAARAAIAATVPNTRSGSINGHSQMRERFPQSSPPPLHAATAVASHGMSLTEIKQIATQIVPCRSPETMVDHTTGEVLTLPCCEKAPVLPTIVLPVGFTSPRTKDHGPTADFTDAGLSLAPNAIAPSHMASALDGQLALPKHLHLNTTSPANAYADNIVDARHSNSSPAMHTLVGSPLHMVMLHGPLAADCVCELCRDLFQAHQLVKILPHCSHAFHSSCIVPYLKHRRDCPRCRVPVLNEQENHHAELSRLKMQSPASAISNHEHLNTGTPLSMREAIAAAATPDTNSAGTGASLNVLTSPPAAAGSSNPTNLTVSALSSCGRENASFEYTLDSVKLTPPNGATQGQDTTLQQRHNTPAALNLAREKQHAAAVASPTSRGSPITSASPTHPVQASLSPVMIPKDR